jgi:heme A synthase
VDLLLIVILFAFVLVVIDTSDRNSETLTLPVKGVNFIIVLVVETLLGEILSVATHWNNVVTVFHNLLGLIVVEKVMMMLVGIIKQVDKDQGLFLIVHKAAANEWIRKIVNRHCVVI